MPSLGRLPITRFCRLSYDFGVAIPWVQRRERRRIRKVMRQEAARAENLQRTQRANKRKTIIMPRKTSTYGTRPGSHYAGVSLRPVCFPLFPPPPSLVPPARIASGAVNAITSNEY